MATTTHTVMRIPIESGYLIGFFAEPKAGHAMIIFAHGSGSSRLSPRNRFVADQMEEAGFGTMLFDLLTSEEDQEYRNRFDIELLAKRLTLAVGCARDALRDPGFPIAFFGASTGAAAAIKAASDLGASVKAVVSRGGRPDLAHDALQRLHCPTLMIVGELDYEVIDLNQMAIRQMPENTLKALEIVPGATHLFEEAGALQAVALAARLWFEKYAATR